MRIVRGLPRPELIDGPRPVVTIGNFDGVHQGHKALLNRAVKRAREISGTSVAITFDPHPKSVIGHGSPPLITTTAQKIDLVAELGIDVLIIIPFDRDFAAMDAAAFIQHVLYEGTGLVELVVGYDFRFGKGGVGHYDLLFEEGKRLGFQVDQEGVTQIGGQVISSSLIRKLLQAGDMEEVRLYLGRDYFIDGAVIRGQSRGKDLGFPTANLDPVNPIIPPGGIYATWVELDEGDADQCFYYGAANIGYNPTFGDNPLSVEVFLLDFDGDLYGKTLRLHFTKRLRDEVKFADVDELIAQMTRDVEDVRALFKRHKVPLERRR